MEEKPDYFGNYHGMGKALVAQARGAKIRGKTLQAKIHYFDAERSLVTALEKAPDELEPPASEEIPALLAECRRQKEKQS
ncbi:MAG: hypothetical protein KJO08_06510 [Gammaproteobacteria bacterium]|nr:hypothetical protein [Gammaproteobacteria bacterium]NNJ84077.1 hypothetical protein [Gammaproteobacteria bacterium]